MDINQQQQKCQEKLIWAIEKLGYHISSNEVEKIVKILVQTMAGKWRYFHTLDHIFMVGHSDNPLEVLAALFHDWVYVQVDEKINFNLSHYLTPYIEESNPCVFIIKGNLPPESKPIFHVVCSIFGFKPNQVLSANQGQNEFLSALAAAKILESILPISIIARIATIIEATIPFRPKSKDNLTAIQILHQRLQETNQKFNLGLSSQTIKQTMKEAVRLTNRDVSSFASENTFLFLDNTWILLPETNHNLINPNTYSIQDYRLAIQKMEAFLYFLKPEFIFSQFEDEPDDETYLGYIEQARTNIAIGKIYLTSKLVTICLLEAISLRFQNHLPLSIMFGSIDLSKENIDKDEPHFDNLDTMRLFLHTKKPDIENDIEQEALNLLYKGRIKSLEFDTKKSLITNFLVSKLGFKKILSLRNVALDFLNQKISGEEFIDHFDCKLVDIIITHLVKLMQRRTESLQSPT